MGTALSYAQAARFMRADYFSDVTLVESLLRNFEKI